MNHCHLFVCLELESCKLFHKCRWGQSSHRCCNINNWDDSVQDLVCALYLHFNVILQLSIQQVEGNGLLEFRVLWKRWHLIYKYSTFTLLLTILPHKTCWVDELKCYNTSNVNTAVFHLHHYFLYVYSKRTPANSSEKHFNLIPCGIISTLYQQTQLNQIWYKVRLDPVNTLS